MAFVPTNKLVFSGDGLVETEHFVPPANEGIYEVIRVISSVPLFVEDHLSRFFHSAKISGVDTGLDNEKIESVLRELIKVNNVSEGNILVSYGEKFTAFFVPHKYPSENLYVTGVSCGLLVGERKNPNAKVMQPSIRNKANEMLENGKLYEVFLVNQKNRITEGSRSNVFFIEGKKLVTSPADEVLTGITREKVINLASGLNIAVIEKSVSPDELKKYDSAFITGTSPKILPVKNIGNQMFDPGNELLKLLMGKYNRLIEAYIAERV